ncbi:hypothetical protein Micbo1qcDRAFT_179672 [Microdochium bolleyi]|uniref:Uncharacterized protein n=1 Tax=Microdochium bolleyi TaxID=196109 RepID=A0A136IP56_9PEZI|nr:hypothetical protein Micbo1qcDRAFT_179672 [Microdochium bolleyi]
MCVILIRLVSTTHASTVVLLLAVVFMEMTKLGIPLHGVPRVSIERYFNSDPMGVLKLFPAAYPRFLDDEDATTGHSQLLFHYYSRNGLDLLPAQRGILFEFIEYEGMGSLLASLTGNHSWGWKLSQTSSSRLAAYGPPLDPVATWKPESSLLRTNASSAMFGKANPSNGPPGWIRLDRELIDLRLQHLK